jgi:hypothetical protein
MDQRTTLNEAARLRREERARDAKRASGRRVDVATIAAGEEPGRCPACGAGGDGLDLDEELGRATCMSCGTDSHVGDCVAAAARAEEEHWMVCLDGGSRSEWEDLDQWAALRRARDLHERFPDALVSMVLLRGEEVSR